MAEKIQKIYDLQEIGGEKVIGVLEQINKQFADIRRSKVALNQQSIKDSINGETEASKKLLEQLQALTVKELELKNKRQELMNQAKQLQVVRAQELLQQRQAANGNQAVAGSYNEIAKKYRELLQSTKNNVSLLNTKDLEKAQQQLKDLKKQLDAFNRALSPDGTLIGEYSKGIIKAFRDNGLSELITKQLTQAKTKVAELDRQFEVLRQELIRVKTTGQGSLDAIEKELLENRNAAQQLNGQIAGLENNLRGTGIGTQIINGLKENFKDLGRQVAQVVIGYLGFQAALSATRKTIDINYELSDYLGSLQQYLKGSKDDADNLVSSLKKIDTRTSLLGLVDISTIVAKKGVVKEEITGVTQALDQLFVVLGKEVGDPHEAVSSLVKLVNVYSEDKHVTAKNINDIGAAIQKLTSSGVATGRYLIDFAERLAGVRGITGVSIQNVLGLGAAIQELGQRSEVASTAASQLIIKIFADVPKYSALAGKSIKEFSKTLNESPVEALIQVAEGLKNNKEGLEEVASAFMSAGIHGARVVGVLGDIAGNAGYMRKRVEDANKAFGDQESILAAAAIKQNTFAATVDRVKKSFELLGASKTAQITLGAIGSLILFLVGILPGAIGLVTLYGAVWLIANASLIKLRVALTLLNIQLKAQQAWLVITTTWTQAYAAALTLFTNRQQLATAATQLFNMTLKENPIAATLAILGLLIATFEVFEAILSGTTDELKEHAKAMTIQAEASRIAAQNTVDQVNKLNILVAVAKNVKNSDDTRKQSIKDLIAIYPAFAKALNGEVISLHGLNSAYQEVTKSIRLMSEAQASAQLSAERQKSVLTITGLRQRVEVESTGKANGTVRINGLSDDEQSALFGSADWGKTSLRGNGKGGVTFLASDRDAIIQRLKLVEAERTKAYKQYMDFAAKKQAELSAFEKENRDKLEKAVEGTGEMTVDERRASLKAEIQRLEGDYGRLLATDKKGQEKNIAQRQAYQDQLDKLDPDKNGKPEKEKKYAGAKIDGETRDAIKIAETETALLKAELEKRKINGQVGEVEYYEELNRITQEGIQKKLAVIADGNAEEKRQRAELQLEALKSAQDTNQATFEILEKRAMQELESAKNAANNKLKIVAESTTATELKKAEAQLEYDRAVLNAQIKFNSLLDSLEKKYSDKSKENAQKRADEILEVDRKLVIDRIKINSEINAAAENEIGKSVSKKVNEEDADFSNKESSLYSEKFQNEERRKRALEELERKHQGKLLDIQRAGIYSQILSLEYRHNAGLVGEEEYNSKISELQKDLAENGSAQSKLKLSEILASWDNFKVAISDIVSGLSAVYQSTIKPLFDLQNQRIDNEQKLTETQLEEQKKRELAAAATQAEQQKIEDKYESLQAQNDKKYAEQRKKIALKELAVESSIAAVKALLSLPDWIQTGINLGLVAATYALQRAKIQATTYAYGGALKNTLAGGGYFSGPSHAGGGIPFAFGGQAVEVEGNEGYVINKKSMGSGRSMTVTGTPAQIASAANVAGGGKDFAPGAFRFDYGGALGMNMQAPVILPRANQAQAGNGDSSRLYDLLMAQAIALQAVNERIDNFTVTLNPNNVTDYQNKRAKAVKIGTL